MTLKLNPHTCKKKEGNGSLFLNRFCEACGEGFIGLLSQKPLALCEVAGAHTPPALLTEDHRSDDEQHQSHHQEGKGEPGSSLGCVCVCVCV